MIKHETFAISTLGCKVNSYESQAIINELTSHGLVQVDFSQKSDIYIINTCTVTNTADSKSRNMISRANKLNPNSLVIVTGCYSQTGSDEIKDKLKVDIIIGNKYKNNIFPLIEQYENTKKQIIKVDNLLVENEFEKIQVSKFENRTRAFIKIQDGCNFMCSYCTIPFARGKQRSANHNDIIDQIKDFIKNGFKEIVLTGVNTAGYLDGEYNFYNLLTDINNITGDFRIRISSVEPFQITDEIIQLITTNKERFCSHWHLCLQSGSDNVLEKMNRKYTTKQFASLIDKIKTKDPTVCISTDYIVGFPTESEEDHKNSIKFLKKIKLSFCHIFTYSVRKGTAASKLKDINGKIKLRRFTEIEELNKELYKNYIKQFIGKDVDVIFEEYTNGIYKGKTSEYIDVLYKSNKDNLINKIIKMKVKKSINQELIVDIF